ncbi:MAG TPA: calcium-binding protein, partial [Microvirga sp.]|nr:calcium-binding protein [Microvirga sp.]
GSEGRLAADAFHLGREASDAEDRVVYDRGRGLLFYDRDGAGGAGQIRIAALTNKAALGVDDLWVI